MSKRANHTSVRGVLTLSVSSFANFAKIATYFADDLGFVFRGHACSEWLLETSLDRLFKRLQPSGIDLDSTYNFVLSEFIRSLRGRTEVPKNSIDNKDELWALGQHHGLATPLLDWTRSLYVAIYFAFSDPTPSPTGFRSVWAMHVKGIQAFMTRYNQHKVYKDQFDFVDPITDHNPRLVSQSGVFTRQPMGFDIVNWIKEQVQETETTYLMKVDLPDSERILILRHLRQMNIHSGTLFPDLTGASQHCNETLELLAEKRRQDMMRALAQTPGIG